jgi:plasmid stabilization system protein ParE
MTHVSDDGQVRAAQRQLAAAEKRLAEAKAEFQSLFENRNIGKNGATLFRSEFEKKEVRSAADFIVDLETKVNQAKGQLAQAEAEASARIIQAEQPTRDSIIKRMIAAAESLKAALTDETLLLSDLSARGIKNCPWQRSGLRFVCSLESGINALLNDLNRK